MNIKSTLVCGVAVIALTALMTGCQHPPTSNSSQSSHVPGCASNPYLMKYGCSITKIQQAAENGSADAQYALGYMYYYGIGTAKDRETGELWIQRSAAQGQPLAKKAWSLINSGATFTDLHREVSEGAPPTRGVGDTIVQQEPVDVDKMNSTVPTAPITSQLPAYNHAQSENTSGSVGSTSNTTAANQPTNSTENPVPSQGMPPLSDNHSKSINDPRLSNNAAPIVAQATKDASAAAVAANAPMKVGSNVSAAADMSASTPVKVASNSAREYTIQLMGSTHLSEVKAFVAAHQLGDKAHYYRTQLAGKSWYMLTYGQYPTAMQANAALRGLPENLQNHHPWVKALATVQKEVQMQKVTA
ncbi:MAG: hypothetical protein A3F13_08440 [Gammaproteobacteria bacterium RIFCSPHIGHO2_12_FULL_40_19]|nr:MAG: hypothetical protein A3F13_08440 [Gammaproteobacteria bacterium RIFCSPHIGHO2_12_FULL_40_19]